ncbi:MAG: hypothetical protein NTZ35_02230 [Ignavibacteriales bacterium]|nr:hypothetical protein [Ignavibacteriales bacterium]
MDRRQFLTSIAFAPIAAQAAVHSQLLSTLAGLPKYSASMWTYLWDIVDEGYEEVFRNLTENGLTAISLATGYHAGKFLEPHNPKRKVVFPEDGTVYFNPKQALYGKLHPKVNSLVQAGHSLERVKQVADKWGMKTRAWVVCCHNTPMGTEHPEVASEDAFGDKLYHNLCPSNPDVRKYLRTLIADIAARGVQTIELEALQFQGYAHGFHHEREGIELTQAARMLLGFCFCPSCLTSAKLARVDLVSFRAFTKQKLENYFKDPSKGVADLSTVDRLPSELIEPFLEWRKSVVQSLLEELMTVAGNTQLRQLINVDPLARKMVSVDAAASAKTAGGLLALGYVKDGPSLREPLKALQSLVGDAEITLGLQLGLPESGGRKEFLEKMSVAKEIGIKSFNFYNYGFVPLDNLKWIKEAVS